MTSLEFHNEDVRKLLPRMIDREQVDVVITSPPYNIGTEYASYKDNLEKKAYHELLSAVGYGIHRVLSSGGHIFLNVGSIPSNHALPWEALGSFMKDGSFKLQNVFHWIKAISIGEESYGHYKPVNSERYVNNVQEYIFHITRNGNTPINRLSIGVPYMDKSNICRWESKAKVRCRGNTWFIPYPTVTTSKDHPATFPLELPLMCLKLSGKEHGVVFDPFLGLGTTGVAAVLLGASKFIGAEIDKGYYAEARNRIRNEQKAVNRQQAKARVGVVENSGVSSVA